MNETSIRPPSSLTPSSDPAMPARVPCTSNKTGDFTFAACGSVHHHTTEFCAPARAQEVCGWCKCRTCDFCNDGEPVARVPAASPCNSWCAAHTEPWIFKCTSFPSCRGCAPCDVFFPPPSPLSPLRSPPPPLALPRRQYPPPAPTAVKYNVTSSSPPPLPAPEHNRPAAAIDVQLQDQTNTNDYQTTKTQATPMVAESHDALKLSPSLPPPPTAPPPTHPVHHS